MAASDLHLVVHPKVRLQDLVIALPSDERHVPLIQASYAWRKVESLQKVA